MTGVIDHTPAFLRYLDKNGISLGDEIMIEEITEYDSSLKVIVGYMTIEVPFAYAEIRN